MRRVFDRLRRRYRSGMAVSRHHGRVDPVPHLEALDQWVNHWVAVKDGRVIAAAPTSRELAYELKKMGSRAKGAVAQFVRPASDGYIVGVG